MFETSIGFSRVKVFRSRPRRRSTAGSLAAALLGLAGSSGCSADVAPNEDVGSVEQANRCGSTFDTQHVELYDGTLGVTQAFVAERQKPVGIQIRNGDTEACSGTLIARDLFLSDGHCNFATSDEVWLHHQVDQDGG